MTPKQTIFSAEERKWKDKHQTLVSKLLHVEFEFWSPQGIEPDNNTHTQKTRTSLNTYNNTYFRFGRNVVTPLPLPPSNLETSFGFGLLLPSSSKGSGVWRGSNFPPPLLPSLLPKPPSLTQTHQHPPFEACDRTMRQCSDVQLGSSA